MNAAIVAAIVAAAGLSLAACGKPRQKRTHDAAAVEIVARPVFADAGGALVIDEIEPNDGEDTATPIPLGATLRGRIDTDTDADHYRLEVVEAGVLTVDLPGIDGVDLILELEDPAGGLLARSDRGGARVREGLPNVGVTPGPYIVVVRKKPPPAPKRSRRKKKPAPPPSGPSPVYELIARVTPHAVGSEREPDDDRGTAIELIVGEVVTGFVGWSGDADVWKLSVETLSEANAIDVEVSAVEGVALSLEVEDGIGRSLAVRKAPRGVALVVRNLVPVVPAGGPPFHYLTIRGDRSNPETAYQLRVTAKVPEPDTEREPNDVPEHAMAVAADRTIVHATWTPGDVDCFQFAPDPAARTLEVTIDTPGESDLAVELLVDGKLIAKADRPGKGAEEKVTGTVPAGVQPVIRVRGTDRSAEGGYDVKVQEGPAPAP